MFRKNHRCCVCEIDWSPLLEQQAEIARRMEETNEVLRRLNQSTGYLGIRMGTALNAAAASGRRKQGGA